MKKSEHVRHLNLDHLAFYRAWMEGTVDLIELAKRYLETGDNRAAAKRTLRSVQNCLVTAATLAGKQDQAHLLMIDESRLTISPPKKPKRNATPKPDSGLPSFEDYLDQKNAEGHFSIQDMIEFYTDEFGEAPPSPPAPEQSESPFDPADMRQMDSDKLRRVTLGLISEIALELVRPPRLSDDVRGWFDQAVADLLVNAGITTLDDLVSLANTEGYKWERKVPRLGAMGAKKLVEWLQKNEEDLGVALTPFASLPKYLRPKATSGLIAQVRAPVEPIETLQTRSGEIAPFDLMAIRRELDGSQGAHRLPSSKCKIKADNDWDAVKLWLDLYDSPERRHTHRSYSTAVERLLLWALKERKVALSSLRKDDVKAFKLFLANPPDSWLAKQKYSKDDPEWRPFVRRRPPKSRRFLDATLLETAINSVDQGGDELAKEKKKKPIVGLSPASIKLTFSIIKGMYAWLIGEQYLDYNPFGGKENKSSRNKVNIGRSLTKHQWKFILSVLAKLPEDDINTHRIRFAIHFAYVTGLRLSELVAAKTSDLQIVDLADDLQPMFLSVLGKGMKPRDVPFPKSLQKTLARYLVARELPASPLNVVDRDTPLIAKTFKSRGGWAMSENLLYRILTEFFAFAADQIEDLNLERNQNDRIRLLQASTHWLRHTHGSHAVANGAALSVIQTNLGHSSLSVTSIYVRSEQRQQAEQMEAFDSVSFVPDQEPAT